MARGGRRARVGALLACAAGCGGSAPPAAAREARGVGCPSTNFPAFLQKFADDTAVQRAFTRVPLVVAVAEYGVNADGTDASEETADTLGADSVRFPVLPPAAARRAEALTVRVDSVAPPRASAVLYKEDSDYQVHYEFLRRGGCWQLTRVRNQSL